MNEYNRHIVSENITITEALKALNELSGGILTLFAIDDKGCMTGTLTDGDIRRHLIAGAQLTDCISSVVFRNFRYLKGDNIAVEDVQLLREARIALVPHLDDMHHIIGIYDFSRIRSILPVDAVLMAGGKGERLRPMTLTTPKPLLKIGERAIIDHNISRLVSYGVKNISVTVNYLADMMCDHFATPVDGVQVNCVREKEFLGTIGAATLVPKFYNDTILVMNSDLMTDINYEEMYMCHKSGNADMTVASIPYVVSVPYAILQISNGQVQSLEEKPKYNYYANAGIYMVRKELMSWIPQNERFDATDLMDMLIAKGRKVVQFPILGSWIDIGNPDDFRRAQDIAKHIQK